jgi:acyl carrier protein
MKTLDAIRQILAAHFFIKADFFGPHKNLRADFGLTSLDFTELVVYLEQAFQTTLPDDELERVRNAADLAACLERHLSPVAA